MLNTLLIAKFKNEPIEPDGKARYSFELKVLLRGHLKRKPDGTSRCLGSGNL